MIARALFIAAILGVVVAWMMFLKRESSFPLQETEKKSSTLSTREEKTLAPAPSPKARAFETKLTQLLHALPTTASLREHAKKNPHALSTELLQAGQNIGAISEQLKQNPDLTPEAERFFLRCALEEKIAGSVRALCYHKWEILTESRSALPPEAERVPESIRQLSRELGR